MAEVARNACILKKRLQRFFNSSNKGRQQVDGIVFQLLTIGEVYLFGGAIRDIALDGMKNFYSDLDFVIDCPPSKLENLMLKLEESHLIKRNKFLGYRLFCDKWHIDIWALKNTWAFQQDFIKYQNVSSLNLSTILNWDGISYQLSNQQLRYSEKYFEQLRKGCLDIMLINNPNPKGSFVRVLRTLCSKKVAYLGNNLVSYINHQLEQFDYTDLLNYEQSHFTACYLEQLNKRDLKAFCYRNSQKLSVEWRFHDKNFHLPLEL